MQQPARAIIEGKTHPAVEHLLKVNCSFEKLDRSRFGATVEIENDKHPTDGKVTITMPPWHADSFEQKLGINGVEFKKSKGRKIVGTDHEFNRAKFTVKNGDPLDDSFIKAIQLHIHELT